MMSSKLDIHVSDSSNYMDDTNYTINIYADVSSGHSEINGQYYDKQEYYGVTGIYISRIFVPQEDRNSRVATQLMSKLIEILDKKQVRSFLYLSPYGDLNEAQLKLFFEKFGYIDKEGLFIREPKQSS